MCGIVGAFDLIAERDFPQDRLLRMTGESRTEDRMTNALTSNQA